MCCLQYWALNLGPWACQASALTPPHLSPAFHYWWVWLVCLNFVCLCIQMTLSLQRGGQIPLKLDLNGWVVRSQPAWMLETDLGSSVRALLTTSLQLLPFSTQKNRKRRQRHKEAPYLVSRLGKGQILSAPVAQSHQRYKRELVSQPAQGAGFLLNAIVPTGPGLCLGAPPLTYPR